MLVNIADTFTFICPGSQKLYFSFTPLLVPQSCLKLRENDLFVVQFDVILYICVKRIADLSCHLTPPSCWILNFLFEIIDYGDLIKLKLFLLHL